MAKRSNDPEDVSLRTLLGDIARDARQLVGEQFDLLKAEAREELGKAGAGAGKIAAGGGLAAAGGLMSGFMAAHLLRQVTGLPMWACYGLAAGGLGVAGVGLLRSGRDQLADLKPLPQTTEALGENLRWLGDRLTPATG